MGTKQGICPQSPWILASHALILSPHLSPDSCFVPEWLYIGLPAGDRSVPPFLFCPLMDAGFGGSRSVPSLLFCPRMAPHRASGRGQICPLIPVRPFGTKKTGRCCLSVCPFVCPPSLLFCPRMALHRASGRGQVCPLIPVRPFGDKKDWQGMPASPSSRSAARPVRGTRARRPPPPRTGRAPAP